MSMLEHAPASAAAGRGEFLSAAGRSLLSGLVRLVSASRSRKQVVYMRDFDDAQLADIGLKRSDVENALQMPLSTDPSLYLVRARQNPLGHPKRF
jgi:uncharacterized protein YjiS (DUF1127 family)